MKVRMLTILFAVVLLCGAVQAADSVAIRLYNVTADAAVANGAVIYTEDAGTPILYRVEMALENDIALGGISLGLIFSGDAGLMINWESQVDGWGEGGQNSGFQAVTVDGTRLNPAQSGGSFDLTGLLVTEHDIDSIPSDEILLGGASLFGSMPIGPMEQTFSYYFTLTNAGVTSLAFGVDSAKVGAAGDFAFVDGTGSTFGPGFSGTLGFTVEGPLDAGDNGAIPEVYYLKQNYPNPFNPTTTINYSLARKANVNLAVYNILGQKVNTLVNGEMDAGEYSVKWEGNDTNGDAVASGIYFYKMVSDDFVKTHKMVLMR